MVFGSRGKAARLSPSSLRRARRQTKWATPISGSPMNFSQVIAGLCSVGFLGRTFLHRTRVEALGGGVAIDQLDDGHGRVVAIAEARLEDADVAAIAVLVTRADDAEELLHLGLVAHLRG